MLGYIIQESLLQFITVVIWIMIGAIVYHLTLSSHMLHWRMFRETLKSFVKMDQDRIDRFRKNR